MYFLKHSNGIIKGWQLWHTINMSLILKANAMIFFTDLAHLVLKWERSWICIAYAMRHCSCRCASVKCFIWYIAPQWRAPKWLSSIRLLSAISRIDWTLHRCNIKIDFAAIQWRSRLKCLDQQNRVEFCRCIAARAYGVTRYRQVRSSTHKLIK